MKIIFILSFCLTAFNNINSQVTIASDNFENGLTFFTALGDAPVYYTGNSSSGDRPASSPFAVLGNYACGKPLSNQLILQSNSIDVSGYSSLQLSLRLAAFSLGDVNNGLDNSDYVRIEISPDNGIHYYNTIFVSGNNNAWWSYAGGTANASTAYDGDFNAVNFVPADGGERTSDGYSTVTITNIPQVTALRIRIYMNNTLFGTNTETMVIDDFKLTGIPVSGPLINIDPVVSLFFPFTAVSGSSSFAQPYQVRGSNLTGNININAPTGFEVSLSSGSGFGPSVSIAPSGGSVAWTTVYTRMNSATLGSNSGTITHSSSGATPVNLAVTGKLLSSEPTVASSLTANSIGGNTATLNFSGGNGSGRLVVVRQASNASANPTDGVSYNSNSFFGYGADQNFQFGVYEGNGTSVTVTGLSPNSTYYAKVFEYNDNGDPNSRNYYTSASGSTSFTTANLNEGLELTATNTLYTIDFDNTVARVNNGSFAGISANTSPAVGELNSNAFSINQVINSGDPSFKGSLAYGATVNTGGGLSSGNVSVGNFYAFEHDPGNVSYGMQTDITNRFAHYLGLSIQNNTGVTLDTLVFAYKLYVRNGGDISKYINLSYSTNNFGENFVWQDTTQAGVDASPSWKAYFRSFRITGISIPNGQHIYLRWTISNYDLEPGVRDEVAIDDIKIVAKPSTVFPTVAGNIENMIVNARTQLNGNTTVPGNILLLQPIDLGNFSLTVGGSVSGASSSSYFRTNGTGNLTINNISTSRTLPVGNSTYNPLTIANGNNLNWTARVDDQILSPGTSIDSSRAIRRTWTITPSTNPPPSGADITFEYNDGDATQKGANYNNSENVQVWHNNGSIWNTASSAITPTGSAGSTRTVTLSNWTQYSPFAVANISAALPVVFGNIKAEEIGSGVKISWTNFTEYNVLHYVVERSADGRQFNSIGQRNAIVNNSRRSDYDLTDISPLTNINYYRIVAIEIDGSKSYSKIVRIDLKRSQPTLIVYPNPVARGQKELFLQLENMEKGTYTLNVMTTTGQKIYNEILQHPGGSTTRSLAIPQLSTGVYLLRLKSDNKNYEMKIVVQ